MQPEAPKRLVVGMSGASGAVLGVELLRAMQGFPEWETHLVLSRAARCTLECETGKAVGDVEALATRAHPLEDIGASLASGTFRTEGMVIVPCSMKTLAGVVTGYSDNLLLRAADVTLKERRRLVLVPREAPLGLLHLRNLQTAAELGATILPPVLTFYGRPRSVEELITPVIGRIIDAFGLDLPGFSRWEPDRS